MRRRDFNCSLILLCFFMKRSQGAIIQLLLPHFQLSPWSRKQGTGGFSHFAYYLLPCLMSTISFSIFDGCHYAERFESVHSLGRGERTCPCWTRVIRLLLFAPSSRTLLSSKSNSSSSGSDQTLSHCVSGKSVELWNVMTIDQEYPSRENRLLTAHRSPC